MAAFIDDAMNIHHVNTLVLKDSTDNVAFIAVLPNFFCMHWSFPCIDDQRISLVMMHQVSLCKENYLHFFLGFGLSAQVSCGLH